MFFSTINRTAKAYALAIVGADLLTGVILDRRYDGRIGFYFGLAVLYPIVYWILLAVITTWASPRAWFERRDRGHVRWAPVRDAK